MSVSSLPLYITMGGSSSKVSRAAGSAARQYPKGTRPPPQTNPTTNAPPQTPPAPDNSAGPTVHPQPQASSQRSSEINLDASDPDFAASLRSLGPVQPNPTLSPTSAFPHAGNPNTPQRVQQPVMPDPRKNPAIAVLDARARMQDAADAEFAQAGKKGSTGREFLDVFTIRQMLVMRDERGRSAEEIERVLGLKKGVVDRLGPRGVVTLAREGVGKGEVAMI